MLPMSFLCGLRLRRVAAAAFTVVSAVACGGGDATGGGNAPDTVASVRFASDTIVMETGTERVLQPSVIGASGSLVSGATVTFAATNTAVVSVQPSGVVRAIGPGVTTVTATADGRTGTIVFIVHNPVASVRVNEAGIILDLSESRTLVGELYDAANARITAPLRVTWTVANATIATVAASGMVTPRARGTTVVTATYGTRSGTSQVRVISLADVQAVTVAQPRYGLLVGQSRTLTASAVDDVGAVVPRAPTWSSGAAGVASATTAGVVTGVTPGEVTVSASLGPATGTTIVTVFAAAPPAGLGTLINDAQFVVIPAGTVTGTGTGTSTLASPLAVQRTEVTQAQWQSVGIALPAGQSRTCALCPVENVTLTLANQFVAALNAAQPGRNYRVPTRDEWVYAARAGVTAADTYADPELVAWTVQTRDIAGTSVVALRQPNAFGLYDVLGNVAELNTIGEGRGGSWNLPPLAAQFQVVNPGILTPITGLRLVRDP